MAEAEQSGRLVVGDEYGMVGLGRPSKVSEALGEDFGFVFRMKRKYWRSLKMKDVILQEHWSGLPFPSPMHESEK